MFFKWFDFKKQQKISKQNNFDKVLIAQVNKKKLPSWKQLKQFPKTLTKQEKLIIDIIAGIILICFGLLIYLNYFQKLVSLPANGGEYSEGLIGAPLFVNPLLAQSHVDSEQDLTHLIFSGLLKYNSNLEITPDLAERYEISEDQKTYTFYLKQNVKWHDNEKFTAADVLYTIQTIQDPAAKSPLYRGFQGVTVEKADDYTIKFTLTEPYAAFLNILTVGIISQHIWEDTPADNLALAIMSKKPIGTGPYKFKSLVKEQNGVLKLYVLEKNMDYYGKVPYINKLVFKFYPDYENAINALINKEVMGLGFLPKEYLSKFANKRDLNLFNINRSQYTAVFFNSKNNELLKEKYIKEALSMAIDKNKLIEEALGNQGQRIDSPILPGFIGYSPDIKKYEFDPVKALELLTTNGWALDGETLKKKDQTLKIVLTTVEQQENIKAANLIKENWNNIGVETEVQVIAKESIENDIINPRNYQALLYSEIMGYDSDLFPFWHSSQREAPGVNLALYANRKADTLLEEARLTANLETRTQKYQEFQNILIDDLPAIFLYSPTYTYPINKKVNNFQLTRLAKPYDRFIGIENWYIKTKKRLPLLSLSSIISYITKKLTLALG